MALSQKYLERLARGRVSQQSRETPPPKTVSPEQMARIEGAIQQERIEQRKEGWRASAKWLEENCEEFRQPGNGEVSNAANGTGSLISCSNSGEPANESPTVESQPLANAPELPQSPPAALSAPSPIPLASAFWQSLLFGNPDALVPGSDATRAIALVCDKLAIPIGNSETIGTLRAGQLRKMLGERFGPNVWDVMKALWQSAPPSPGAPQAAADQSQLAPGPLPADRRWIRDLHDPDRAGCRIFKNELGSDGTKISTGSTTIP